VAALRDLGHDVVVVARGNEGYVADSVRAMGVPYHGIRMKGLKDILFLRRLVRSQKIEIIHSNLDRADYVGLLVGRLTGIPVVSTMMVPRCHPACRFMDKIAVLSNKQRDILLGKGIPPAKIEVIRPGIDIERFSHPDPLRREQWKKRTATDDFDVIFCHISSMLPRKAHRISLELLQACRERGVKPLLFIIGDPLESDYVASLKEIIARNGLDSNVVFTGWTRDVPEILSLSHFTVLPSADEALGVVLMEGMAAGTPIIARNGEGGAELVDVYETGFLFREQEGVAPLAEHIITLRRDQARYNALSGKCRETAESEFSMAGFGNNLHRLYVQAGN